MPRCMYPFFEQMPLNHWILGYSVYNASVYAPPPMYVYGDFRNFFVNLGHMFQYRISRWMAICRMALIALYGCLNIIVTGGNCRLVEGCHFYNLRGYQWRQSWLHESFRVSVCIIQLHFTMTYSGTSKSRPTKLNGRICRYSMQANSG